VAGVGALVGEKVEQEKSLAPGQTEGVGRRGEAHHAVAEDLGVIEVAEGDVDIAARRVEAHAGGADLLETFLEGDWDKILGEGMHGPVVGHDLEGALQFQHEIKRVVGPGARVRNELYVRR
jgi:hypothetical protein